MNNAPFRISTFPSIGITFLNEHSIQFGHLFYCQIAMLSRLSNRNRHQFLLLDIGEGVFLIGEVTHRHALIPNGPTRTKVYSTRSVTNFADNVACFVLYAIHHAIVPIFYVFFVDLEANDRSIPHNFRKDFKAHSYDSAVVQRSPLLSVR